MIGKYDSIDGDKIPKTIAKYIKLMKENNISVIAVNLDQMFNMVDDYENNLNVNLMTPFIVKDKTRSFFTQLFKSLLDDNCFKIAIVMVLKVICLAKTEDDKNFLSLCVKDGEETKISGNYTELEKYFSGKKYKEMVLNNKSVLEIVYKGKEYKDIKHKIEVVPEFNYVTSEPYNYDKMLIQGLLKRKTNMHPEEVSTCVFMENIFKIPVHECVFITQIHNPGWYNYIHIFVIHDEIQSDIYIYKIAIHNFTNSDLIMYTKKFSDQKNIARNIGSIIYKDNTLVCVVVDDTLEQLNFARCLDARSIIVLTDGDDKWENGLLYRNRNDFLSNNSPTTYTVAVPYILPSKSE